MTSAVDKTNREEDREVVRLILKQHNVYLHYDLADLEQDRVTAQRARGKVLDEKTSGK